MIVKDCVPIDKLASERFLLPARCIQLFQLRLSPSKAEKSNTSAKGLLGIANKLMNFLAIPSKSFALVFDFSALLGDNLNLIEIAVYKVNKTESKVD